MTDGIIQKIIKRHMHLQDGNEDTCAQCNKLIEIEQELIEEIKKQSSIGSDMHYIELSELIGDNPA